MIIVRLVNGYEFTLNGSSDYTIGRRSADHPLPDLDLADFHGAEGGISREHARIHVTAEGVFVEDLNSASETVQNGYRLMPLQWYPLHHGDELRLGALILRIYFAQPRPQ